jgi:hypothetical protein
MAERIEDHREVEAAEFEAEQPARDLSGLPKLDTAPQVAPWSCTRGQALHDEQAKT